MPRNTKSSNQKRIEFIKLVNQPTKLSEKVLLRIVSIRVAHKHWGADKIRAILKREHCSPLPGRTTIHRVLRPAGLINQRRKRIPRLDNLRLVQDEGTDLQVNDEWTIDFKGWWRSKDGERKCYPCEWRARAYRPPPHLF